MKFTLVLLVAFVIVPQVLIAQVLIIEHQPREGLSPGDIVQGILEVGGDLPSLSSVELVGKDIGRTFHIFRATQEGPLYRLGLAVFPWAAPGDSLNLEWKNQKVQVEVKDLKFKSVAGPIRDEVVIEETPWTDGKISWMFFAGIFISVILLSAAFYATIRGLSGFLAERRSRARIAVLMAKWQKIFFTAKSREDFETIYKQRKKWLRLVGESESIHVFFEVMKRHQYKPDWTEAVGLEVRLSFKNIDNIFRSQE